MSKYIPMRADSRADATVDGILKIEAILANMSRAGGLHVLGIGSPTGDKSASGMPPNIVARFNNTALNPVLLDASSFWLIM